MVSDSFQPCGLSPWNSPGQNTGVGSLITFRDSKMSREKKYIFKKLVAFNGIM